MCLLIFVKFCGERDKAIRPAMRRKKTSVYDFKNEVSWGINGLKGEASFQLETYLYYLKYLKYLFYHYLSIFWGYYPPK